MVDVKIQTKKNGPLLVTGVVDLLDSEGNPIKVERNPFALCRCGASSNKPFCDGTHSKIGFEAADPAVSESKE